MKLLWHQIQVNQERQREQEIAQVQAEREQEEFEKTLKPVLVSLYERSIQILSAYGKTQHASIAKGSGGEAIGVHLAPATRWATPKGSVTIGGTIGDGEFGLFIQTPPHLFWMDWCPAKSAIEWGYAFTIAVGAIGLAKTLILCGDPYNSKVVSQQIEDRVFKEKGEKPTLQDLEEFTELVGAIEKGLRTDK